MNSKTAIKKILEELRIAEESLVNVRAQVRGLAIRTGCDVGGLSKMTKAVCGYFGQDPILVLGRRRDHDLVVPRQVIFWIAIRIWNIIPDTAAQHLGFHRTNLLHGARAVTNRRSVDAQFKAFTDLVVKEVRKFEPKTLRYPLAGESG